MSGIELLAPLRIETRFRPPDVAAGHPDWVLCLRAFPDEFSIERSPAPRSPDELDRLDQYLAAPFQAPPIDPAAAFRLLASAVGARRALWLIRTTPTVQPDAARPPTADRSAAVPADPGSWPATHRPAGLPAELQVWTTPPGGGAATFLASMALDRAAIAADLDLSSIADQASLLVGELPVTWWTSFERAKKVGLGAEITLGPDPPSFEALFVLGLGDTDPSGLVTAHADAGRLAVLPPGTPTNTVEGEATTELGDDPDAWFPLLGTDPASQGATIDVFAALSGTATPPIPLHGGDLAQADAGRILVTALWPVLWSRAIRDVAGGGKHEHAIADWAQRFLAPEGPHAAIRVGEQPYGILPTTSLGRWVAEAGDPEAEQVIVPWASNWRSAAAAAAAGRPRVGGAGADELLAMLGEHAPSIDWGARLVLPLALAQAWRAWAGLPSTAETAWDDQTAGDLGAGPAQMQPIAPVSALWRVPTRRFDKPDLVARLAQADAGELIEWQFPLGLLGHMVRESLLIARARTGQAYDEHIAGAAIDPATSLPVWPATPGDELTALANVGIDANAAVVDASGDPEGRTTVRRLRITQKAVSELARLLDADPDRLYAALWATLDTASFRVDPWVTGIAERRLQSLIAGRAPVNIGAYGWVDGPAPYTPGITNALPPGPTVAGLLHAPSRTQALTAALLRDAAVRMPGDDRWRLTIDSAKVRAANRLAERVRLGVHPYEALGLEVERLAGTWDTVRILRQAFPFREGTDERQTCDGARALRAILHGAEPLPAGLPPDLASRLQPADDVLDTYADLLVADGVHALVSGRADLANAAMEAAAGLGAPPELRAIHTARNATTVRVSAWALVPGTDPPAGAGPSVLADPALAALIDAEVGEPGSWTWTITNAAGPTEVSLADRRLRGLEVLDLGTSELAAILRGPLAGPVTVASTGGAERLAAARRLGDVLGGADSNPPVPSIVTGRDDKAVPDSADPLRAAMLADLGARLTSLVAAARQLVTSIDATDSGDPAAVDAVLAAASAWRIAPADASGPAPARLASLRSAAAARVAAAANVPATVNALRGAIRALSGNTRLPVLPRVPASSLPALSAVVTAPDGRPETDRTWLEIVAAAHPRLALLEARQLDTSIQPWPAAMSAGAGGDPWTTTGPLVVAYGPGIGLADAALVGIAGLDAWVDSIPSSQHATSAAFGFNGPKSRAPQAILLAVPPDVGHRITIDELVDIVGETRQLVRARAARPVNTAGFRVATPSALLHASRPASFADGWEKP